MMTRQHRTRASIRSALYASRWWSYGTAMVTSPKRLGIDSSLACARIALSLATLLAIYVDPAIGGLFVIDARTLAILLSYLAYALLVHEAVRRNILAASLPAVSVTVDVLFAVLLGIFTEGHTS